MRDIKDIIGKQRISRKHLGVAGALLGEALQHAQQAVRHVLRHHARRDLHSAGFGVSACRQLARLGLQALRAVAGLGYRLNHPGHYSGPAGCNEDQSWPAIRRCWAALLPFSSPGCPRQPGRRR